MNSKINEAKKRAKLVITSIWENISKNYTFGWMGPLEVFEQKYPHISKRIDNIRNYISHNLPIIIYATREEVAEHMIAAIPNKGGGINPYNCRLISSVNLAPEEVKLLNDFAQAFWFLIDNNELPQPELGNALEDELVKWTGRALISP